MLQVYKIKLILSKLTYFKQYWLLKKIRICKINIHDLLYGRPLIKKPTWRLIKKTAFIFNFTCTAGADKDKTIS